MMGLIKVMVALVIPIGSSLPRVCSVQLYCADIQVFIQLLSMFHPGLQIDSGITYLNVKDNWILKLGSERAGNR